jgi:histidine triad (HIT) family protein
VCRLLARRRHSALVRLVLERVDCEAVKPHDPHCVFCKIVCGDIPSARVIETDESVAFLDINPVIHGHTLLVPKAHYSTLADLPDALAGAVCSLLPRIARAVFAATGAQGLNVIVNNGRAAGQTIDHCHWHFIPRFNDDPVNWPWPHSEYAGDELRQIRLRIERELKE